VSIGVLSWLAWRMDWAKLANAFAHLRLELWAAAVVLYLATQVVSGWRWQLLARPLGFDGSVWKFTSLYFVGMFFNLLLPTSVGGDVVRAWYLDNRPGRRLPAMLSVLVDRASGLMLLILIACGAVLVAPGQAPRWTAWCVWGTAACAFAGVAMLPIVARCGSRFTRLRASIESCGIYLRFPQLILGTSLLSFFVQGSNVILVWLLGRALDAPVPGAYYWVLVPMVSVITLLPISMNGMGIREGSTALFLAPFGVPQGTAVCLAILWFSVYTAVSVAGGCLYLAGWYPRPKLEDSNESIGRYPDQGRARESQAAA
jgi:glycosyltransferase 2 family protein